MNKSIDGYFNFFQFKKSHAFAKLKVFGKKIESRNDFSRKIYAWADYLKVQGENIF